MNDRCERCGGEMAEVPSTHPPKKIKVCKRCEKEDWKRLFSIPDESTVYGNDCRDGKCEM